MRAALSTLLALALAANTYQAQAQKSKTPIPCQYGGGGGGSTVCAKVLLRRCPHKGGHASSTSANCSSIEGFEGVDGACTPCRCPCGATEYEWPGHACSKSGNRKCVAAPSECPREMWYDLGDWAGGRCKPWTNCTSSEFEALAPSTVDDRVCSRLTECSSFEYEAVAPTPSSDRKCAPHDNECPGEGMWLDLGGGAPVGRCKPWTNCTSSEFEALAPSTVDDRVCSRLTECSSFEYEAVAPTPSSDRKCNPCYSDPVAPATCTKCQAGEFEIQPPQYTPGNAPGAPNFIPAVFVGRVCGKITTCKADEIEWLPPTASQDRVCTLCRLKGRVCARLPTGGPTRAPPAAPPTALPNYDAVRWAALVLLAAVGLIAIAALACWKRMLETKMKVAHGIIHVCNATVLIYAMRTPDSGPALFAISFVATAGLVRDTMGLLEQVPRTMPGFDKALWLCATGTFALFATCCVALAVPGIRRAVLLCFNASAMLADCSIMVCCWFGMASAEAAAATVGAPTLLSNMSMMGLVVASESLLVVAALVIAALSFKHGERPSHEFAEALGVVLANAVKQLLFPPRAAFEGTSKAHAASANVMINNSAYKLNHAYSGGVENSNAVDLDI